MLFRSEHAARYVEDWCTLLAFLAMILLVYPALCALAAFVWGWILLRKVLKTHLPGWAGKVGDALYAFSGKFYKGKRE